MTKSKTPFFSMGAKGTVGGVLTAQKRGGDTILRSTPVPTDPYSLAQAYQRWDYRDYAYRWTLLTDSQKQVYRTSASKYHITGFSLWMRENLKALTNLVGRWHLDERSGAIAYDSSKNANNATIVGATPVPGLIDYALSFDGLNDFGAIPYSSLLDLTYPFTVLFFMKSPETGNFKGLIGKQTGAAQRAISFYRPDNNKLRFHIWDGVGYITTNSLTDLFDNEWHAIAGTLDADFITLYLEGVLDCIPMARTRTPATGATYHWELGRYSAGSECECIIDHLELHDTILTPTEIKRHAERRYPA